MQLEAAARILASVNTMKMRIDLVVPLCRDDHNSITAHLDSLKRMIYTELHALTRKADKVFDENAEEADTASKQFAAVAGMCSNYWYTSRACTHSLLRSASYMNSLATRLHTVSTSSTMRVPVSTMSPSMLLDMSTVWHELPDGAVSTCYGSGLRSFVKGAAGATRNVVLVSPRVSSGALAEYVKPDDVCLVLRDDAGSLIDVCTTAHHAPDGAVQVSYTMLADCVSPINVTVTVCGVSIGTATSVSEGMFSLDYFACVQWGVSTG